MNRPRLKFYLHRLKNASCAEIFHRLRERLTLFQLRRSLRTRGPKIRVPPVDLSDIRALQLPIFLSDPEKSMDEEISRRPVYLAEADACDGKPIPDLTHLFFADIDYQKLPFDIRPLWEQGRLQHVMPALLSKQKMSASNPETVGEFVRGEVLGWIDKNPFPYGPHYLSAMECGMRVPVFFCCLKLVDDLSALESAGLLQAIYLHGWLISKRLSLYSSLGNHTIAECVGLIFAGAVFGNTRSGKRWLKRGFDLLKSELVHQVLADGGPLEQSLSYHRFVVDLYWLSVDFLERNGLYDCSDFKPRLTQGESFLDAFQDKRGNMPMIGDSDDGHAVAPGIAPRRGKSSATQEVTRVFEDSGYTVIRPEDNVIVTFDHGPLGMPPLYNHGHADALSVTLTKDNQQILVDPGTYRYNGAPDWRRYFKGTRAHNTVTVDGLDQAVQETGFIWSRPYKVTLLGLYTQKEALFVKAIHDGYSRLKEGVRHERSVFFLDERVFFVKDRFHGDGTHEFELNYHLHPDAVLTKSGGWWRIHVNDVDLYVKLLDNPDFIFVKGQKEPLRGWYSPTYGVKMEAGVLTCSRIGPPEEVSFLTAICTGDPTNAEVPGSEFLL